MLLVATAIAINIPTVTPTVSIAPAASVSPAPTSVGFSDNGSLITASDADLDRTLTLMTQAGARSVRISIPWYMIEPVQGQFNWYPVDRVILAAQGKGLSILGILGYTPGWATSPVNAPISNPPANPATFGTFAGLAAARYIGRVSAYEIYNEPNGSAFYSPQPDPAGYARLMKAAYPAIKRSDPSATVVGGVLGATESGFGNQNPVPFLASMYAAGAAGSFDALSYHPYQYTLAFGDGVQIVNSPAQQLMDIRALMVQNGDSGKKIWATEYGVPTSVVSEDRQNVMLSNFLTKWQELPFAGPIYLFQFRDTRTGSSDSEDTFGLVHTDYSFKPAIYTVLSLTSQGIPKSAEYTRMTNANITGFGNPISVVFPYGGKFAQKRETGTVFETNNGFLSSPLAVGNAVLPSGFIPLNAFTNGMQDFNSPYGMRAYSSAATGTHLIGGGIVARWQPSNGLATSDEIPQPGGGVRVNFQNGSISWP